MRNKHNATQRNATKRKATYHSNRFACNRFLIEDFSFQFDELLLQSTYGWEIDHYFRLMPTVCFPMHRQTLEKRTVRAKISEKAITKFVRALKMVKCTHGPRWCGWNSAARRGAARLTLSASCDAAIEQDSSHDPPPYTIRLSFTRFRTTHNASCILRLASSIIYVITTRVRITNGLMD